MENSENIYGIHENGEPLTLGESNDMQILDIVRFTQVLATAEHLINAQTTLEERHQFESVLKEVIVTPHGDPALEWKEFQRHKRQQHEVLSELFSNPEGLTSISLFVAHIAPLFGDGTKKIHMPVEQLERRLEDYYDLLCKVPHDIVHLTAEHNMDIPFHEALALFETRERIVTESTERRYLAGDVLAPHISTETGLLLPPEVTIDFEGTSKSFDFEIHDSSGSGDKRDVINIVA